MANTANMAQWFPDGRKLCVIRIRSEAKLSLWSIGADGSQAEELITPDSMLQSEGFPVSPDGNQIIYASRAGQNYQLYAFDMRARQARQLGRGKAEFNPSAKQETK